MRHKLVWMLAATCVCLFPPSIADAQQQAAPTADESEELAKKLSNPISDLVSVPFQFNWYQHVGPLELSPFALNVQPVIPLKLNDHWNLILRIIVRSSARRLCLTGTPRARAAAVPDRTRSLINSRSNPQCSRRLRRRADHSA